MPGQSGLEAAANDLKARVIADGGTAVITSAFRPYLYQSHFFDVRRKAITLFDVLAASDAFEIPIDSITACERIAAAVTSEARVHRLIRKPHTFNVPIEAGGTRQLTIEVLAAVAHPGASNHVDLTGVDIDVNGLTPERIDELAAEAGLRRPLPVKARVHFQLVGTPNAPAVINVTGESPINLLVTGPDGRRIGSSPQGTVNDYGLLGSYSGPFIEPQRITIYDGAPGGHTITGIGTGNGPYRITVAQNTGDGEELDSTVHDGTAVDGQPLERVDFVVAGAADSTPPVIALDPHVLREATGPNGAVAEFAATATDDVDGGVAVHCVPPSGSMFPLGSTTVTCTASDAAGNQASASSTIEIRDTTAPVLTVPADLDTDATSPDGATVTFAVSAMDLVDPAPSVACQPSSGSRFATGTTQVTCTAADPSGKTSSSSFSVHVAGASEQLVALIDRTLELLGRSPLQAALRARLQAALDAITARRKSTACTALSVYITVVERAPATVLSSAARAGPHTLARDDPR